jgi:hemerythrin-like metal-binding protein
MTALAWSEDLCLNQPQMDQTHQEFVELLAQARVALEGGDHARALSDFEQLIDHTVEHFAQEDRWMLATGYAPQNCHTRQHETVLTLMREVLRLARDEASWEPLRVLVSELALWFPQHAQMMDAGLAQHLAAVGYDIGTGRLSGALPEEAIRHCGGVGCHS